MFWKRRIYLDYASGVAGNPSSPHGEGRRAKKKLEDARTTIARLVEVQSDDVIFTSGATEANALAIFGVVRSKQKAVGRNEKIHALYLPSAHASIIENMKLIAERGVEIEALPVNDGLVNCVELKKLLRPQTRLIAMEAVCGETGVVWNTREVAQVLKTHNGKSIFSLARGTAATREENAFPVVLHVDASQAPLTEKMTRAHFGADLITFDASKVGEVRGIGALIAHRTIPITPLYAGGGQERGLRPGSESPELAQKFAAALYAAALGRKEFSARASRARTDLIEAITTTIPNVFINEGKNQASHILNLSLSGRDTDYLIALMDEAGFAVSSRSACETDSEDGSRAVVALTGDKERSRATLRISWGPGVGRRGLARFARALAKHVAFIDSRGQW